MIMLYRLAGKPAVSGGVSYADVLELGVNETSDTYRSILWAEKEGITAGYADATFRPLANCLREHIVTFMYRYAK